MTKFLKIALSTICFVAFVSSAFAQDQAGDDVDRAGAAAVLAEINAISVIAKSNLGESTKKTLDDIAEAQKRSDAVDATVSQANEAYLELERAIANNNQDEAKSAFENLLESLVNAVQALNGDIPDEVVSAVKQWKESKKNTGAGPGKPYDPPNMYDIAWNSQTMRDFYTSHFGNFWGSGVNPTDKEATPE